MLKYSTYQSIYNHEISGGDRNGGKLKEQLHAFQAMFTRRLMVKLLLIVIIMTAGCTGMVRVFARFPSRRGANGTNRCIPRGHAMANRPGS